MHLFEIIDERVTEFRDIPQREERQKKDKEEKKGRGRGENEVLKHKRVINFGRN